MLHKTCWVDWTDWTVPYTVHVVPARVMQLLDRGMQIIQNYKIQLFKIIVLEDIGTHLSLTPELPEWLNAWKMMGLSVLMRIQRNLQLCI